MRYMGLPVLHVPVRAAVFRDRVRAASRISRNFLFFTSWGFRGNLIRMAYPRVHLFGLPRIAVCTMWVAVLVCTPLPAQEAAIGRAIPAVPAKDFNESFDQYTNVSGSPLVGLSMGLLEGKIDLKNLIIAVPPDAPDQICINGTTQDGRFSAENPFNVIGTGADMEEVLIVDFTFKYESKFSTYIASELAVRSFQPTEEEEDCAARGALNLPLMASDTGELVAMVNSRSRRTTAKLTIPDNVPGAIQGTCNVSRGRSGIAFDTICKFPVDLEIPTEAELEIVFDDGFGKEVRLFRVFLPASDK